MPADDARAIARRLREDLWNTGDETIADQLCAGDAVFHVNDPVTPELGRGPAGLKQLVKTYRTAFPDAQVTIDDIIVEGNKAVIRWTGRGTHKGNLGSISPTGKPIKTTGVDILRIEGGKIKESWTSWDTMGLLQQLGALQQTGQGGR